MAVYHQVVCVFLVLSLLQTAMASWGKGYSDSWAVQVDGGYEVAEEIARKHGFAIKGQVGLCYVTVRRMGTLYCRALGLVQSISYPFYCNFYFD